MSLIIQVLSDLYVLVAIIKKELHLKAPLYTLVTDFIGLCF